MIKYKVVLVPFPFDDFSSVKVRPAVCLTNPVGKHEHVVIAFISSKLPDDHVATDLIIKKNTSSFRKTGLMVDSVIRVHKLITVPKTLFKRQLGILDASLQKELDKRITLLFK
jgi:mRNA interferase MazF